MMTPSDRWERLTILADCIEERRKAAWRAGSPRRGHILFKRLAKVALAADKLASEHELPANVWVYVYGF